MEPRRFTYYLGIPEPSWLNHNDKVPKCATAARFDRIRSGNRLDSKTNREWPITTIADYIIDSGAYTALTSGNMASTWWDDPETYGSKILTFMDNSGRPPAFCAQQDLPCEPAALAATGWTVDVHQKLGLENYLFLADAFPMVPWVPVLQGWDPEQYLTHERMFLDAGVDLAALHRVGIGSICKRGHVAEIAAVIGQFAGRGYRLHGFGIKTTALPVIGHLLTSADSMAWSVDARYAKTDTRTSECRHDGKCNNCYGYAKRWRRRVLDLMSPPPAGPPAKHVAGRLRRGDIVQAAQLGITGTKRGRLLVTASAVSVDRPGRVGIVVADADNGLSPSVFGYLHTGTPVDVVDVHPAAERINRAPKEYPLPHIEHMFDINLAIKALTTEEPMPAATIVKPAAAAGGDGTSQRIKSESLVGWHMRGKIVVPRDLSGYRKGDVVDAFVCCLCGGVEFNEFGLQTNHGCCTSASPWCSRTKPTPDDGRKTLVNWAEHWKPLDPHPTMITTPGGLEVGDVFALLRDRRPRRLVRVDAKASDPGVLHLVTATGEVISRRGHERDLERIASARPIATYRSWSQSMHLYLPLTENRRLCGFCSRPNHPFHMQDPDGPGRMVPVVPAPGVQLVAAPGDREAYKKLVHDGQLINMAGQPLVFENCVCNRGKVSGMTCPQEIPCTQCGAKKGETCKRPSEHEAADYHQARKVAADEDMRRREAAGDLTVPAPWPGTTTTETTKKGEVATVTAPTTTEKIRWTNYKGADAVSGSDLKPGEEIRCPVSGCDRRAKIRRDGKVGAHKMYGSQSCRTAGKAIPAPVMVDVLSRRAATASKVAAETQLKLDGMGEVFAALLAGKPVAEKAPAVEPARRALPPVYVHDWSPAGVTHKGVTKRVDELQAHDVIACDIPGAPGLFLYHAPTKVDGHGDSAGNAEYIVEGSRDGERPCEKHRLWGSEKVTVVADGVLGWRPGHFRTWKHSKCKVRTLRYPDGLRIDKVTYAGIEAKDGKKKVVIAYSDITEMEEWGTRHLHPGEAGMSRAMNETDDYYGFDAGEHEFRPTFAGSLRCRVCCGSIRSDLHTGVLNADFQQFEAIRMEVLRPGQTGAGISNGVQELDRYVRGIPLVRYDRDTDVQWTFVCPVECGGGMFIGHSTLRGARGGWFKHCAEKHNQDTQRWGTWMKSWRPTWDDAEHRIERQTIGFRHPAKVSRDSVEKPVVVKVKVPLHDPAWEKLIERFEAEGRSMSLQDADMIRNRFAVMSIMFNEGKVVASTFRAELRHAGIPDRDIEIVEKPIVRVSLAECLAVVHDPKMVNRSTGTVQEPEGMFAHLDKQAVAELLACHLATESDTGKVRAVILHTWSGKVVVIGHFDGWAAAWSWWNKDFNKFKRDENVRFLVLAEDGDTKTPKLPVKAEPKPVAVAEPLFDLSMFVTAMQERSAAATVAPSPAADLAAFVAASKQLRQQRSTAAAAAPGKLLRLTDVPKGTYIEVTGYDQHGRLGAVRTGYLTQMPRISTAGWGSAKQHEGDPVLAYTLTLPRRDGNAVVGMRSPAAMKATVLESPEAEPQLVESEIRPIAAPDLRQGDVVAAGFMGQRTRAGRIRVLARPVMIGKSAVRIRIEVGGAETTARLGVGQYVQVVEVAAYRSGDDLKPDTEPEYELVDTRALNEEALRVLATCGPLVHSNDLVLWAMGVLRLREAWHFWQSMHSGDQMARWVPKGPYGRSAGHGSGRWIEGDKGGFTVYAESPKPGKKKSTPIITEQGWDRVLGLIALTKLPAELVERVEHVMAEREAANPGQGYTVEDISPAPRDGESLRERDYRFAVEEECHQAAMAIWQAIKPAA